MRFPAGFKGKSAPNCNQAQAGQFHNAIRRKVSHTPLSECQQRRNHDLLKKLSRD